MEHPLRRFRLAAGLPATVGVTGITGYRLINGWDLLASVCMVIITISTVGRTRTHPQRLAGRAVHPKRYIVARAGRPAAIRRLELAGATRTISPYVMAGHRMAELAIRPAMVDLLDTLHHGEAGIGVEEMVVAPGTSAIQKTLDEAGLLAPEAARVLAVRKSDGTLNVNPQPGTRLDDGDLVIALGTEDQLFASASKLR